MTIAQSPPFGSLALRDQPPPDWTDVVVESLPAVAAELADPTSWAREIFSTSSVPAAVTALMGLRELLAPLVGATRGSWDAFAVREVSAPEGPGSGGAREALISHPDRHLDFRAAVGVDPDARLLWVTTAVWFHGRRGRTYFLPVRFLHDPVTRAMMRRAIDRCARGTMAG